MSEQSDTGDERKKTSLVRRLGLGALGAAFGILTGFLMFGDALGMLGSALVFGLGFALGLGGDGAGGMAGDGGGGSDGGGE